MKKLTATVMALLIAAGLFTGCAGKESNKTDQTTAAAPVGAVEQDADEQEYVQPKYVFLFIGDGMAYPQIQSTADYLGALNDPNYHALEPSLDEFDGSTLQGPEYLNFMNFEAAGSAVTFDSNSFAPDSASTGTSLATGYKTYSGTLNLSEDFATSYETIAEKVHDQLGMQVGIVSTVNLNHATPAAFYAHQASRNSYYDIGLELIDSGFEYFAGGGLKHVTGKEDDQTSLYDLAEEAGYLVVNTAADTKALNAETEKVIAIEEHLADSDASPYAMDLEEGWLGLSDYVSKGIDVMSANDKGFFMMVESGKIDWACHANDAAATITDTVALAEAVQVAIDFAAEHPEETLILVTGDHETGGMTIGFAGTDYDTYLDILQNQKISQTKYASDYVSAYVEEEQFETVMADVTELFGLSAPGAGSDELLEMTPYERSTVAMIPLSVKITHILNNKAGIDFSSYSHTGLPVAVLAEGVNAAAFNGYYDNTDVYNKLADMLNVE